MFNGADVTLGAAFFGNGLVSDSDMACLPAFAALCKGCECSKGSHCTAGQHCCAMGELQHELLWYFGKCLAVMHEKSDINKPGETSQPRADWE